MENADKLEKLRSIMHELGSVVVAYSGGTDSAFLAQVASVELGDKMTAITAVSPSVPKTELKEAAAIAAQFGFQHVMLEAHEIDDPRYQENTPLRCYWCKQHVYGLLVDYARQHGFAAVIDGFNADDVGDYRPGHQAAQEFQVRSPLFEAGLTKAEIRTLSKEAGLPNWDRPAKACLASRVPYGKRLTPEVLEKIEKAETYLEGLGLRRVRLRHHDNIARIEVDEDSFPTILKQRMEIVANLRELGYTFVTLDLCGYQVGSMNLLAKTK